MTTRDLINAIESGDSTKIDDSFNNVMVQKVSERLDAMRDDLSQNMFRVPEATIEPEVATEVTTEEPTEGNE
jgi:hypothetical protein